MNYYPTSIVTKDPTSNTVIGNFPESMEAARAESTSPRLLVAKGKLTLTLGKDKVTLKPLTGIYNGNSLDDKIEVDAAVESFEISDQTVSLSFIVSSESSDNIVEALYKPETASISVEFASDAFEAKQFAFEKEGKREWDQLVNTKSTIRALSENRNQLVHLKESGFGQSQRYQFVGRLDTKEAKLSIPQGDAKGAHQVIEFRTL